MEEFSNIIARESFPSILRSIVGEGIQLKSNEYNLKLYIKHNSLYMNTLRYYRDNYSE